LRGKLREIPGADAEKEVLRLVMAQNHLYYFVDEHGNYWRMYKYIKNTKSIDIVETEEQAFEGGKAFGRFQVLLFDLDINLLSYTIPAFHHIGLRLTRFNTALQANPLDRKKTIAAEVEFIQQRIENMCAILNLGREEGLPLRITHNDTKFNNILLDMNDKAQCVIDLDTVMPGYVAYDFGDAVRTIINTASEDEKELDKIRLNMPLFEAFTKGYLKESASLLTSNEIKSLPLSVLLFPYMQGVRFLTDYLNGDTYYKIQFPDHNLQRTRAQFQLLRKLEEQYDKIEDFILGNANRHLNIKTNSGEAV
jgi:Ser/Thr protein kinase RdoA (MazF antagonist)